MTIRAFLKTTEHPDARLLITGLKDWTLSEFLLHLDDELSKEEETAFRRGIERISAGEPLQYV
ncbi:MAG: hypothetical protein IKY02_05980, partial [Lachnospiraceae bacterium]|nr:hypothetical protein [Lachnospiraceae bacterium]